MDINDFKPSERMVEILNPKTGEQLEIRVTLLSINDDRLKKIKRRIADEKLRLEARGKNFKSEDVEDNLYNIVFNAMTGWEWYGADVSFKGVKPEFNRAQVQKVLEELPWFLEQIQEAVSDEKAFFQS